MADKKAKQTKTSRVKKRKAQAPKKTGKSTAKGPDKPLFYSHIAAILILIVIVVVAAVAVRFYFPVARDMDSRDSVTAEKQPPFEIYPPREDKPVVPVHPIPPKPPAKPEVAIIIDDMGYSRRLATRFADMGISITFSVLPISPFTQSIADKAYDRGVEIMMHLPMEPSEYPHINPGPGALLVSMSPDALIHQLKKNLDLVPHVVGVNNHMGSRLTTVSSKMYQVFSIIKKRDLFFIDSRTTANSVCRPSARMFQIRYAERDVFLDHVQDKQAIKRQIARLVRVAEKHGKAIGIGHPHTVTCEALEETIPRLRDRVQFVHASRLVRVPEQETL